MKRLSTASVKISTLITISLALFIGLASPVSAGHEHENQNLSNGDSKTTRLIFPMMNAERGKKLFVAKGCVTCHAVNGVGGEDAPAMDEHIRMGLISPFDYVAKMWNHAPGMLAAQEEAFGESITFTGEEISDIIAFVHDDRAQHSFNEKDLTEKIRKMMHHEHEHGGKSSEKDSSPSGRVQHL